MSNLGLKFHRLVSLPAMAVALGVVFTLGASDAIAAEKQLVFGASVPLLNDPAWVRIIDYGQYVAKQLGVTLDVVDAQGREDKQIADVQSLLSRGVDVLIFVPVSAANAPAIIRLANRAKVPAIADDRYPGFKADNVDAPYLTFVGPDNVDAGRKIGEYMISHGVKNFVAIKGTPGDSNSQERFQGFQDAVTAHAADGVKLLQEIGGLQTEDNGYAMMQNLLSAHPSGTIDGVFCYNDALCVGAYRAIKQAGRDKEIRLGATDLNPQALDLIKANTNYIYSIGGHWVMVGFAVMIAYDYMHGHKPLSDFSRIEDVGVDAAGFEKFKAHYIDALPSFDIKQYMLTFNPNAKTQTPPLTLE